MGMGKGFMKGVRRMLRGKKKPKKVSKMTDREFVDLLKKGFNAANKGDKDQLGDVIDRLSKNLNAQARGHVERTRKAAQLRKLLRTRDQNPLLAIGAGVGAGRVREKKDKK